MTEGLDISGARRESVALRRELSDFGAFYERAYDTAYRTALGIVRDPVLAADVTQDAFVAAYRHRRHYRGDAPSTAWLHRIIVNQALAALRRRRPAAPEGDLSPWTAPDAAGGSVARMDLLQALDILPARHRAAVILRYYHDYDYAAWHAAALLPDGRVLVVGGGADGVRVDVGTFTEIYEPQTGRFIRGPVTNQPRVAATAVSLPQGVLVLGHYPGNGFGGNAAASRTAEVFTVGQVERPVGCCLDNPGFVSVSATAEQPAASRAALIVPAGALEGAAGASAMVLFDWPGGGTGDGFELALPNCGAGCSIPIELAESSSVQENASVTVAVDIAYQGPPPPQVSGIQVVIDAND